MNFREEFRNKHPKLAARVDSGSRPACIKAFCLECVGGVRDDVTNCTDAGCPLYPVRPYRVDAAPAQRTEKQMAAARALAEHSKASRGDKDPPGISTLGDAIEPSEGQDSGS